MIGEWLSFDTMADLAHGNAGEWLVDTLIVTAALMALVLVLRRPVARQCAFRTRLCSFGPRRGACRHWRADAELAANVLRLRAPCL